MKASSIESSDAESDLDQKILDTVGAIAIDKFGNVASAVSSGGIMFKGWYHLKPLYYLILKFKLF